MGASVWWKFLLPSNCCGSQSMRLESTNGFTGDVIKGSNDSSHEVGVFRDPPESLDTERHTIVAIETQQNCSYQASATIAADCKELHQRADQDSAYLFRYSRKSSQFESFSPPVISSQLSVSTTSLARQLPGSSVQLCSNSPQATGSLLSIGIQVQQLQLLGRGGHALVLRGVWQLAEVAVKLAVADPAAMPASTFTKLLLEGPLSKRLRAPNVVETYCYSIIRITQQGLEECRTADEAPVEVSRRCLTSGIIVGDAEQNLVEYLEQPEVPLAGLEQAPQGIFDSFDGFGCPGLPRFATTAVMSFSDALSAAAAVPGCYLTHIVMELCDQGSLASAVARGAYSKAAYDRIALFAYLRTLYDIAAGMSYLHSIGVIHGDLKPGNVLLCSSRVDARGYQAKVADFGLSQCVDSANASLRHVEADWSSHHYMAPEHFDGRLVPGSDVWNFGATAHHMWVGVVPHARLHPLQVCAGVCDGSLQLETPPGMPPRLWLLLRACMAKQWMRRPSFPQIRAALQDMEAEFCGVFNT